MLAAGNVGRVGLRLVVPAECRAEACAAAGRSDSGFELSSTGKAADSPWQANPLLSRRQYDSGHVSPEMREKIEAGLIKCSSDLKEEFGDLGQRASEAIAGLFKEMMDLGVTPPVS